MAVQWWSTPESVKKDRLSVLAVVETLLAMGLSLWIAVQWQTYVHIAVGACIAPLLLMRTNESCLLLTVLLRYMFVRIIPSDSTLDKARRKAIYPYIIAVASPVVVPVVFTASHVISLTVEILRHPAHAAHSVPANWRHSTLVLDSLEVPQVIPLPRSSATWKGKNFQRLAEDVKVHKFFAGQGLFTPPKNAGECCAKILLFAQVVIIVVLTFSYRWSLKSTAIIWFPLLWSLRSVGEAGAPLRNYFGSYVRDPFSKLVVIVSAVSLALISTKIVLWYEWSRFVEWWNETPLRRMLSLYVSPGEIQKWQWAVAINSVLAFVMYVFAMSVRVKLQHKMIKDETWLRRFFQVGLFIRPFLSCYTIACTLYITIRAASEWQLPPLGEKWFPWL